MKWMLIAGLMWLAATNENCGGSSGPDKGCYKGRLEIRANCMNYTISVLEGNMDSARIVSAWTNPATGKEYKDAFALGSPCNFPDSIKEGDEFYFVIDSTSHQQCAVCLMYYPTPPKKLSIKVLNAACTVN